MKTRYVVKKIIFAILILLIICGLFRTRKYFVLKDFKDDMTSDFSNIQLKQLKESNTLLDLSFFNVMYLKKNIINFYVYSITNYSVLKIKTIDVIYDGKIKKIKYNVTYDMNINNPNRSEIVTYEFENDTIQVYKKIVRTNVFDSDTSWINFYDLFKWRHGKIGDVFDVKLIVHYEIDDCPYTQELYYKVKCAESFPARLIDTFIDFTPFVKKTKENIMDLFNG